MFNLGGTYLSYKFIFDTSAIDFNNIAKLKDAGIEKYCLNGKLSFYLTPPLLNETADFIPEKPITEKIKSILTFLIDLKHTKIFNEISGSQGIFTKELEGAVQKKDLFTGYNYLVDGLSQIVSGRTFTEEEKEELRKYKNVRKEVKLRNKEAYLEIREKHRPAQDFLFEDFLKLQFENWAIAKINKSINSTKPKHKLVTFWKAHKELCPYFNKFIEGEMFTVWASQQLRDIPIDTNALDDIEHLVYLTGIDGIISNDRNFMKYASKALFPNKDYLTVDQYIQFLKSF